MNDLAIFGTFFILYWLWVAYEFWRAPLMEEQPDGSWKTIKPTKKLKDLFKKKNNMGLREATAELHSKAEKMEFNQRMFRGELSKSEYLEYLRQQSVIFTIIESNGTLPHSSLAREKSIFEDIKELEKEVNSKTLNLDSTKEYGVYLQSLDNTKLNAHIYLNYLALAYGGQIMKKVTPGGGKMYDFENMQECVGSVRAIQNDEMADEVNKGFNYIINILDELQNTIR